MYSNCCCSCSFEPEIIKIGRSSHKIYSNDIVNFQEPTTILNACTKMSGNLLNTPSSSLLPNDFKLTVNVDKVMASRFLFHSEGIIMIENKVK